MAENTGNTQQSSGQLIPIVSAVVLIGATILLFLLWQDSDTQLGELQDDATSVAAQAENSANRLLTATAVLDVAMSDRDSALAEATEAVGQAILSDSMMATADSARELAETAQAEAITNAENVEATSASDVSNAMSTADSAQALQVAEAENAQATAQTALDFQETAVAVAATTIAERDSAQAERDEAQANADNAQAELDSVQAERDEAQAQLDSSQSTLDELRDSQLMEAARLGLILNQLATAEAQNTNLEAENAMLSTAIASGATLPPPPPTPRPDDPTPTPPPPVPDGAIGYTSNDGSYSFAYPDTWFFIEDLGTDTVLANTAEASVELTDGIPPSAGSIWMYVGIFDLGDIGDMSSFLSAAVSELRPDATQSDVVTNGNTAYVDLIDQNNRLLLVDLGNGRYGLLDIVANSDEIDSFMAEIMIVVDTLQVN